MDARQRQAVATELFRALMGRVQELFVLSRLFGQPLDQKQLVERMEADLSGEIAKIGTYPSVYTETELAERKDIATQVVARIRQQLATA